MSLKCPYINVIDDIPWYTRDKRATFLTHEITITKFKEQFKITNSIQYKTNEIQIKYKTMHIHYKHNTNTSEYLPDIEGGSEEGLKQKSAVFVPPPRLWLIVVASEGGAGNRPVFKSKRFKGKRSFSTSWKTVPFVYQLFPLQSIAKSKSPHTNHIPKCIEC